MPEKHIFYQNLKKLDTFLTDKLKVENIKGIAKVYVDNMPIETSLGVIKIGELSVHPALKTIKVNNLQIYLKKKNIIVGDGTEVIIDPINKQARVLDSMTIDPNEKKCTLGQSFVVAQDHSFTVIEKGNKISINPEKGTITIDRENIEIFKNQAFSNPLFNKNNKIKISEHNKAAGNNKKRLGKIQVGDLCIYVSRKERKIDDTHQETYVAKIEFTEGWLKIVCRNNISASENETPPEIVAKIKSKSNGIWISIEGTDEGLTISMPKAGKTSIEVKEDNLCVNDTRIDSQLSEIKIQSKLSNGKEVEAQINVYEATVQLPDVLIQADTGDIDIKEGKLAFNIFKDGYFANGTQCQTPSDEKKNVIEGVDMYPCQGEAKLKVNDVFVDTSQQASMAPPVQISNSAYEQTDKSASKSICELFIKVFQTFNIWPDNLTRIPMIHNVVFRAMNQDKNAQAQEEMCVDTVYEAYLRNFLEVFPTLNKEQEDQAKQWLLQSDKIAFMVRSITNTVACKDNIQQDQGGGHHTLLLLDQIKKTIYQINDAKGVGTENGEAFSRQIHLFLQKIGLNNSNGYRFEMVEGKSRLPEDENYVNQPCSVSQFLSYLAVLSGVKVTELQEEIPARVALLIYLLNRFLAKPKGESEIEALLKSVMGDFEQVLNQKHVINCSTSITEEDVVITEGEGYEGGEVRVEHGDKERNQAVFEEIWSSLNKENKSERNVSKNASETCSSVEDQENQILAQLKEFKETIASIGKEKSEDVKKAMINSSQSTLVDLNFKVKENQQFSEEFKKEIDKQYNRCVSRLNSISTPVVNQPVTDAPETHVGQPIQASYASLLDFKEMFAAFGTLGILGITIGIGAGPLWMAVAGAVVATIAAVLLVVAWIKNRACNPEESLIFKSQTRTKLLENSSTFYGVHRNGEMRDKQECPRLEIN